MVSEPGEVATGELAFAGSFWESRPVSFEMEPDCMKVISVAGDRVVILLDGKDSHGQYTVMESTLPPKAGPPPHVHTREDEAFLVLTGEVTFYLGDKTIVLHKGESLFAPRNIPHHFKNTGTEDAVLLETASPAGLEDFFIAAGKPLVSRRDPPVPPTTEDLKHMRAIAPDYGITILVSN